MAYAMLHLRYSKPGRWIKKGSHKSTKSSFISLPHKYEEGKQKLESYPKKPYDAQDKDHPTIIVKMVIKVGSP